MFRGSNSITEQFVIMACEGKVALVTGSAEGLGKAIADALLSQGAKVCVCDFNVKLGEQTTKSFEDKYGRDRVFFSKCDVRKDDELEATFQAVKQKFGGLHIMVNNAGILDEIGWRKMIDVNMIGAIRGTELAVEAMRTDKGGQGGVIVNIASVSAVLPLYNIPVYTATKHAVIGFTRSCADNHQYQQVGLSFACVCPAGAETTIHMKDGNGPRLHFPFPEEGARHIFDIFGTMSPNKIGEALLQVLEESTPNGAIVTVSEKKGVRIAYPDVSEAATLV